MLPNSQNYRAKMIVRAQTATCRGTCLMRRQMICLGHATAHNAHLLDGVDTPKTTVNSALNTSQCNRLIADKPFSSLVTQ